MNDPNYIFVNTDRPVSTVIPVDGKTHRRQLR